MSSTAPWEIEAGASLPSFERVSDFAHWNRYAAVNDEFVPMHMDPEAGRAAGQRDAFGMGNLRISYLHNLMRDWLGDEGDIVAFACQFRGFSFKGDVLTARASVVSREERDGAQMLHLALGVDNQDGLDTTPAEVNVYDPGLRASSYDGVYAEGVPVGVAMATTRWLESRNTYDARAAGSTATFSRCQ